MDQDKDDRPPWQKGFPNMGAQDQDDRQQGFQAMAIPQDKDERQMPGPPQGGDISDDLMMKVRQHQQLLDLEQKREAQQKLMEHQQMAMLDAQRTEQQRMLPQTPGQSMTPAGMSTTPSIRSSGVSMVSAPLNPPGVVIPPGSQGAMPGQQMMQQKGAAPPSLMGQQSGSGGPPPLMGQKPGSGGPPPLMGQQTSQGGLQGQQPPPLMQGNQQGGPRPLLGDRTMINQGAPKPLIQQGGPPGGTQMPQDNQSRQSMGGRLPQDGPRAMQQGGPPSSRDGPPPLMSQSLQQRGPPMAGPPGGPISQGGPQQMSQNNRPQPQDKDERVNNSEDGPRGRMGRPPFNGPNSGMTPGPGRSQGGVLGQGPKEMRLPAALEKMLEFKSLRENELGSQLDKDKEAGEEQNSDEESNVQNGRDDVNEEEDDDDETPDIASKSQKDSKNKRKKKKKKRARKNRFEQQKKPKKKDKKSKASEIVVEYIQEQPELDPTDPNYNTFAKIFEAFKIEEPEKPKEPKVEEEKPKEEPIKTKGFAEDDDDDDDDDDEIVPDDEDGPKISKKKLKKLTRLTVAQLKQLVTRPDVVEMHDVTARDPRLLVHLKATRNSVQVPRHWSFKRKYLQGKRGIEKTPFELPDFIKATGIEEMRAALQEKEDQKTLKSKMREKVRPKMGKIDIDYQKLHDAFFRFQTKPRMTVHGDLYYEAKEFETKLREKKPGNLSDDLKMALGMPIGNNSEKVPPPWLIAMQRYGPPPSYPNLKIAGLNGPIPEGCMFGYHAGGWGKPPVDEHGKPLYGDVFGTAGEGFKESVEEDDIDKTAWGELESESESESEEESEEEEEKDETGLITPAEGLMTPGGITSVPLGMETPDQIELRKRRIEDAMDQGGDTPALYQVLPEKKAAPVGGAMMGSAHVYDMAAVAAPKKPGEKGSGEAVEVSLNPEELDLDTAAMQAKYDQTVREQQSQLEKEDLSDMVAAHAAKQRKRKKAQQDTGKAAKKYKDFKF